MGKKDTRQRQKKASKSRLPDLLRTFFWDYDFDVLNWEDDRELIIGRILTSGDWNSLPLFSGKRVRAEWPLWKILLV